MTWLALLLLSLAVFRVARMLALEEGPFAAFHWMRERAGQRTWFGRGLSCPLCWSFWLSFIAVAVLLWPLPWHDYIIGSLGVAGGAVVLYQVVR